jgi:hypothetical protein
MKSYKRCEQALSKCRPLQWRRPTLSAHVGRQTPALTSNVDIPLSSPFTKPFTLFCERFTNPSVFTQRMLTHAKSVGTVKTLENVGVRRVFEGFRFCLGSRRPWVQIPPPRLFSEMSPSARTPKGFLFVGARHKSWRACSSSGARWSSV